MTVRVGVTGHRELEDIDILAQEVRNAIQCLRSALPIADGADTPIGLAVISALAEGADQLVARELIAMGATLEAVIPFAIDDYMVDFTSEEALAEFNALAAQAQRLTILSPAEDTARENAYLDGGQEIVRRSDIMVAVWDGAEARGKGGTGDIVAFARAQSVPIIWISTDGRHRVTPQIGPDTVDWERLSPLTVDAFAELEQFNAPLHRGRRFEAVTTRMREGFHSFDTDVTSLQLPNVSEWIAPYFARAELQANFFEAWYKRVGAVLFMLSFLAVATVAAQELFLPGHPGVVWAEVAFLCLVGIGLAAARHWRLHERWITARYLGETFRAAAFLAVAGIVDQDGAPPVHLIDDEATDEWLRRAFAEVWRRRPLCHPTEANVGPLQRFLAEGWIADQADYHKRTAGLHGSRHDTFTRVAYVFFSLSIAAAVLHSLDVRIGRTDSHAWWGFASIIVPAAAAALSGLAAQREYHQHGERYRRMAQRLTSSVTRMRDAPDLASVQLLALETERIMREENGQWFGVVRLHDLELPG